MAVHKGIRLMHAILGNLHEMWSDTEEQIEVLRKEKSKLNQELQSLKYQYKMQNFDAIIAALETGFDLRNIIADGYINWNFEVNKRRDITMAWMKLTKMTGKTLWLDTKYQHKQWNHDEEQYTGITLSDAINEKVKREDFLHDLHNFLQNRNESK